MVLSGPAPFSNAGIFLHILADTLGSVGVIISSALIHQFGRSGAGSGYCAIYFSSPSTSTLLSPGRLDGGGSLVLYVHCCSNYDEVSKAIIISLLHVHVHDYCLKEIVRHVHVYCTE